MADPRATKQAAFALPGAADVYDKDEEERFRAEVVRVIQDSAQGVDFPEVVTPSGLSAGFSNNFDLGPKIRSGRLILRVSVASGNATLSGFLGGMEGVELRVSMISGSGTLFLVHENSGSLVANRIITPSGIAVKVLLNGWVDLLYDGTTERWRVTGHSGPYVNADIAAGANVDVTKLLPGTARQVLQTNSGGSAVEWSSGISLLGFASAIAFRETGVSTLLNNATPPLDGRQVFKTGGTTTITDFDDGVVGQRISILAQNTVTITHNASIIVLTGSVNFNMVSGDTLVLQMFNDQVWHEISRSVK